MSVGWRHWCGRFGAQGSDGVEQLTAIPDKSDTKVLQVLSRQTRQDRVVDLILAECRLILIEAKAPCQPPTSMAAPLVRLALHDPLCETACLGLRRDRCGSKREELNVKRGRDGHC